MFLRFIIRIRVFAADPITEWATAILSFLSGLVALLVVVAGVPIVPPEVAAWLVSIVAFLNTLIALLKRLVPAPAT